MTPAHAKTQKPACPKCGNRSQRSLLQIADTFKCGRCGAMYDSDPDEGGTYFTDPSKRLEREEAERARRQQRRR
jgi:ribosomal protein S27AE